MTSFRSVYTALLLVIAGSTHKELARQVTYLKAENQILRRRLPDRISLTQSEKNRLILSAKNVGLQPQRGVAQDVVQIASWVHFRSQRTAARNAIVRPHRCLLHQKIFNLQSET